MLVKIPNIANIVKKLPQDKADALIRFDDVIYDLTVDATSSDDTTEVDKLRSYFIYMQEFIQRCDYDIEMSDAFMQMGTADLKKLVDELDKRIKRYVRPYFDRRAISEIRSSMATALAPPDAYIEGVILDQPTKGQIRQYIERIKKTVENSDLTQGKQEALLAILNEFLVELDKDKTGLERWAEFYVLTKREVAKGTKWALDTAERAETIWSSLTKGKQSLPAPERGGEIEGPQKQLPAPEEEEAEDDAAD